jgi:hypothetical protein
MYSKKHMTSPIQPEAQFVLVEDGPLVPRRLTDVLSRRRHRHDSMLEGIRYGAALSEHGPCEVVVHSVVLELRMWP